MRCPRVRLEWAHNMSPPDGCHPFCTRGFSLVEVALAIGILGFSLLAIMGLLASGSTNNRLSAERVTVQQILDWCKAETRHAGASVNTLGADFDFFGSHLPQNAPAKDILFHAALTRSNVSIPGSATGILRWRVQINAPPRNHELIWEGYL